MGFLDAGGEGVGLIEARHDDGEFARRDGGIGSYGVGWVHGSGPCGRRGTMVMDHNLSGTKCGDGDCFARNAFKDSDVCIIRCPDNGVCVR